MWIKELWLLVLVENKESRKNWEYHDKKKKKSKRTLPSEKTQRMREIQEMK